MMRMLLITAGLLLVQAMAGAQTAVKPRVVLAGAVPDEKIRVLIQDNLAESVYAATVRNREKKPFSVPAAFQTTEERREGVRQLKELTDTTKMTFDERLLESDIIGLVDGSFEVRRIYMTVKDSIYTKSQEMVATFGKDGFPIAFRFAMAEHQYDAIVSNAEDLQDDYRRKQLISYLERFRTAYNRKDADFIEQQFSDNALIITGTKIEVAKDVKPLAMKTGTEAPAQYKLTRQTKQEYIANLRNRIFKLNSFIDLQFEDIKVYAHPDYPAVYGVNLLQKWTTSRYSDVGYLFLMIDYTDELRPLIYVRAWQPENMIKAGAKVLDIDSFELIK